MGQTQHTKIVCKNCSKKQNKKYIKAMLSAGFGLQHLECKECGQKTLKQSEAA